MTPAIGIDLGTTNSVIAHINPAGRPEVIPSAEGQAITPSVVYFGSDPPLVGDLAKEKQAQGDNRVASFFKRYMGDPTFVLNHNGRDWTPTDLSALILAKLTVDAESALGTPIRQAVITVPAYFNNAQREATIAAGQQVGLEVLGIINEQNSKETALAYRVPENGKPETVLVYDLGGGTFDVSLVRLAADELTVLATDGDHFLGGKDWDDCLANYLAGCFAEEHGVNPLNDNLSFNELLVLAERTKKALKDRQTTRATVHHDGRSGSYEVTRARFEELTRDLMERTQRLCERVLQAQKMTWAGVVGILLVGGSTRMPMVHKYVRRMSGKNPMSGVNVDEAVALGAAVMAGRKLAERLSTTSFSLSARRLGDVVSHSLGVVALNEKRDGYFNSIIIPKNSPFPCVKEESYQIRTRANQDNQFDVFMLQGESADPTRCHVLGKYVFSGIAHMPVRPAVMTIEFGYDSNSVITVAARDGSTGKALKLTIESLPANMSWLSGVGQSQQGRGGSPYTLHAGQQRIPGAITDKFGNAAGSQYDLAEDGAFEDCLIAVLHLYTSEGFDFRLPEQSLQEKGFRLRRWSRAPSPAELAQVLEEACQLWIISDRMQHLGSGHLQAIRKFFESGRGLYLWGDNDPFYADANFVAQGLFGSYMTGDSHGNEVVRLKQKSGGPGFVRHLITTGVENLYEGITVATIEGRGELEPLLYDPNGNLLVAIHDRDGRRAILDGGFTRLYMKWDTAGTGRYVKNAASWLVNYEHLGLGGAK